MDNNTITKKIGYEENCEGEGAGRLVLDLPCLGEGKGYSEGWDKYAFDKEGYGEGDGKQQTKFKTGGSVSLDFDAAYCIRTLGKGAAHVLLG